MNERIEGAARGIDAALAGLEREDIYLALCTAEFVPPGKGRFGQGGGSVLRRVPRLPWDAFFMLHAHLAATRSTCDRGPELLLDPGRRGVGAVLVFEKRIIAGGYNGSPPGTPHCSEFRCSACAWKGDARSIETGDPLPCPDCGSKVEGGHLMKDGSCVRTIHAEANALLQCAMDGTSPRNATVYTTASPCWDCAKSLVRVKVGRVVYGTAYGSRYGLSERAGDLLRKARIRVEHLDVREALL